MTGTLEEILEWYNKYLEEVKEFKESGRAPEHPQYIEGTLYVTQSQYVQLYRHFVDSAKPLVQWQEPPKPLVEIPVVVIKENQVKTLPSGKVLVYSKALENFYVFDPKVVAGLTGVKAQLDKQQFERETVRLLHAAAIWIAGAIAEDSSGEPWVGTRTLLNQLITQVDALGGWPLHE